MFKILDTNQNPTAEKRLLIEKINMAIQLKLSLDDFHFASKIATIIDDNATIPTTYYSANKRAITIGYRYKHAHHDVTKYIEVIHTDKQRLLISQSRRLPLLLTGKANRRSPLLLTELKPINLKPISQPMIQLSLK